MRLEASDDFLAIITQDTLTPYNIKSQNLLPSART